MTDKFALNTAGLNAPASNAFAISPSNTADLATATRFLYVGSAGDIAVDLVGGDANVIFKSVPVGIFPLRVKRVRATGTTATNLIGAY
jgi:hypothetical protein